ncbi:helix-turn-helix transcriptional regulator [Microbacterium sp. SSW1-49]|uniref:Helix-turn-helix transcriptional regulator n=1 Tax=Microbacterium croceum TaxID=2851645 RepID=A0ABT0FEH6_9MICO|nr:helix-turn-helix transcriptional regulator [Microbacterium croceum]MCK2036475.1 helix-turn-helix transcriptional regulator [Microbacterium croceum]
MSCAPHVVTRLVRQIGEHSATIREVAERLAPAQRYGAASLPTLLPLVPTIVEAYRSLRLTAIDRDLILAVSLCLDDQLEPVLDLDGRSADEIAGGPVGEHVRLHAGRITLVDPRLAIWIRHASGAGAVAAIHERLGVIFARRADPLNAAWHRVRSSLRGQPSAVPVLIPLARELSEQGHSTRALELASEAEKHADELDRDEAKVVAGAAALGAGFVSDAVNHLDALFPDGAESQRLQALAALLIAQSTMRGSVPDVAPADFRPRSDDAADWHAWTRASALTAGLCAERGDRRRMRVWLDAVREGSARLGTERALRDPAVALSWLVAGDVDTDDVAGAGPLSGGMLRALRTAVEGDIDLGLRILATGDSSMGAQADPFVAGFENSALVRAYRAIVEVLLLSWRGDIGMARDKLVAAARELPVALPFAGLGVVLARRLDLAVLGELGPYALALTDALPPGVKIDRLVDRSVRSYLDGDFEDAAAAARLWLDMGAPQTTLAVPGLDEVLGAAGPVHRTPRLVRPPDLELASVLRLRLQGASEGSWRGEHEQVHRIARTLRSPFERARVEAMIGAQAAIRDDRVAATAHLRAAASLFEVAGAAAWSRAMHGRLARLDQPDGGGARVLDPLGVCRRAWTQYLTARELDVAMLASTGASNREIADALVISVRTVEVHLGRAFTKLDVRTRVELTVLAHRTNRYL